MLPGKHSTRLLPLLAEEALPQEEPVAVATTCFYVTPERRRHALSSALLHGQTTATLRSLFGESRAKESRMANWSEPFTTMLAVVRITGEARPQNPTRASLEPPHHTTSVTAAAESDQMDNVGGSLLYESNEL